MSVEQLDPFEQGIILGALLDSNSTSERLDRLRGPAARRCADALRSILDMSAPERRRSVIELSRRLMSPVPANIHRVHPSWISHLLGGESACAVTVVREALPRSLDVRLADFDAATETPRRTVQSPGPGGTADSTRADVRRVVCRRILGQIVPMPLAARAAPLTRPAELVSLRGETLEQLLVTLGLLGLASLASRAGSALEGQLRAKLGGELGEALRQEMKTRLPVVQLPGGVLTDSDLPPERLLFVLGCHITGPWIPRAARRQTAQLLPRRLGLLLETAAALGATGELPETILRLADRRVRGDLT